MKQSDRKGTSVTNPPLVGKDAPRVREMCCVVLRVARSWALRVGLPVDQADDCAVEFLEQMIRRCPHDDWVQEIDSRGYGWLGRCAANWAKDSRRHRLHVRKRETLWTDFVGDGDDRHEMEIPGLDHSQEFLCDPSRARPAGS